MPIPGPVAFYDLLTEELGPRFWVPMDQVGTLWDEVAFAVARANALHGKGLVEGERTY